jgi:hypothetical protein
VGMVDDGATRWDGRWRCWCRRVRRPRRNLPGARSCAHGEQEFRKDIVTVADGVYVAVGYSMANVTLIVGDGGAIIVDTPARSTMRRR